jgi:RHS repeat-associated protein
MATTSIARTLVLAALIASSGDAVAQGPRDGLVQTPTFKQPERGSLAGTLAKFSIGAEDVSRGSYALPMPIEVPSERGPLLAAVLPAYAPENGISEWGLGWSAGLAIQRFRLVGDVDYQTDSFTSPWGRLELGADGFYYPAGLKTALRVERRSDRWIAVDSQGTRHEFAQQVTTSEGVYAWYLTGAETIFGDATAVEYTTSAGGRPFVSRVLYGGREDTETYRLDFEYEALPVHLLDYRSGAALSLDRRVSRIVTWAKEGGRGDYRLRWHHDLEYRDAEFGPAFHLDSVQRTFASGDTEPSIAYEYDLQEQPTPEGFVFATGDMEAIPGLADYLAQADDINAAQPERGALTDIDDDGLPDLEHAADFTLYRQSPGGEFSAEPLPPPSAEADPFCRPNEPSFNQARTLVRMAGPGTEMGVLVLEAMSNTTEIRVCDRTGVPQFAAEVPGRWILGANSKLVDLNRDERPDLLMVAGGQYQVLENISGDGCGPGSGPTCVPFGFRAHDPVELSYEGGFPFTPSATWAHDLNGDGNPDLVQRTSERVSIWYGRGRFRFEDMERSFTFVFRDGNGVFDLDEREITWIDANKDGLTDALLSLGLGARLFINEGDGFQEVVSPMLDEANDFSLGAPIVGDFRGRGDLDFNFISIELSTVALTTASTGLLIGADDGKGTEVSFDYERADAAPGLRQRPSVLRSLTVASAGDEPVTHDYAYGAPRMHAVGHFLVGFGNVDVTSPMTRTIVDFHHDDDVAGQVETSRTFDDRTPGIMKFSHTDHEEAFHAGVRFRRNQKTRAGWCGAVDIAPCLDGTAPTSAEVVENLTYERDICPTRVRRTDRHGQLVTETGLASPSELTAALHCLPAEQVWIGTHSVPARDFRLHGRLERNSLGQVTKLEQIGGAETLTLQVVTYDPATHRIASASAPGHGLQLFTFDPDTGQLDRTTAPDGVVASIRQRDPQTDALLELVGDRGPGGVLVSSFRYDGMERFATSWSDFGGSSETQPLQSVSYRFPTGDLPGLIRASSLVDAAAGARQETASWSHPDGTELAAATRIPGGWAFGGVSSVERGELRTRQLRRSPLAGSADLAAQTYASLLAETVELGESLVTGFGSSASQRNLIQEGIVRELVSTQSIADGLLVTTSRENDSLDTWVAMDTRGHPVSIGDQVGNVTRYQYDAIGRLVQVVLPGGAGQELSFDAFGRPAAVARDGVGTVAYAYQPTTGLLESKEYRDTDGVIERTVEFEYDDIGRLISRSHAKPSTGDEAQFTYRYDGEIAGSDPLPGQLGYTTQIEGPAYTRTSVHNPDGSEASSTVDLDGWMKVDLTSTYHAGGALKELHRVITRLSDGAVIDDVVTEHAYDAWGRLAQIIVNRLPLATIHHDEEGRVAWVDLAGGHRIDHLYDAATHRQSGYTQEVHGDTGTWQSGVEWGLNARGLVEQEAIGLADQSWRRTYDYDPRGYLASVDDAEQLSTYSYSAAGRLDRIEDERGARTVAREDEEVITVGDVTYEWDASGRVTARGDARLSYGADGHLSVAEVGARTLVYHYDADGNRLLKVEDGHAVAAYVGGGYLTDDVFISPVKIGDRVVGVLEDGAFQMLATDPRGTVLADRDGTPRLATPYGVRGARPDLSVALDYVEKAYDPDIGTVRMGVRDYDPLLGQFWSPDPLYLETIEKCAESPVDCNLYSYARNNPLTFVDPDGTDGQLKRNDAVEIKVFGKAAFEMKHGPLTVSGFEAEVKIDVPSGSLIIEGTVLKLTAEKKGKLLGAQAGVEGEFKAFGAEVQLGLTSGEWSLVAIEVKGSAQFGAAKLGVSAGIAAGGKWGVRNGKLGIEIKLLVGVEFELDVQRFFIIEIEMPELALRGSDEETGMRFSSVSMVEAPPPAPKLRPMPRRDPRPQAPRYRSCADPEYRGGPPGRR